ncbi:MAG: hypothetical protein AAF862_07015, partial [Pseudomonadota bacterium]
VNILLGASPNEITEGTYSSNEDASSGKNLSFRFKDVCEALALRRADAIEAGRLVRDARELQKLMLELQCTASD